MMGDSAVGKVVKINRDALHRDDVSMINLMNCNGEVLTDFGRSLKERYQERYPDVFSEGNRSTKRVYSSEIEPNRFIISFAMISGTIKLQEFYMKKNLQLLVSFVRDNDVRAIALPQQTSHEVGFREEDVNRYLDAMPNTDVYLVRPAFQRTQEIESDLKRKQVEARQEDAEKDKPRRVSEEPAKVLPLPAERHARMMEYANTVNAANVVKARSSEVKSSEKMQTLAKPQREHTM